MQLHVNIDKYMLFTSQLTVKNNVPSAIFILNNNNNNNNNSNSNNVIISTNLPIGKKVGVNGLVESLQKTSNLRSSGEVLLINNNNNNNRRMLSLLLLLLLFTQTVQDSS